MECVNSKSGAIAACVPEEKLNVTINNLLILASNNEADVLFSIPKKECQEINEFGSCTVNVLKTCTVPEPADFLDGLTKLMLKEINCSNPGNRVFHNFWIIALLFSCVFVFGFKPIV